MSFEKKMHNKDLGQKGEILAAGFLREKGYEILAKNFRSGHQEIDLIAEYNGTVHFVEVKTRSVHSVGRGEDAMHRTKILRLLEGIYAYLTGYEQEPEWQLDLIVVETRQNSGYRFYHYEGLGIRE
ncbi:MAG: YraN family protein [Anaerolineaceae bacterium]|nr:YraN family protein [Anaerolineaceae bacterium]